ncbi:MAG TPA: nuclease-related domain-containing protein [Solirubrobacterales bacterium]|nr:nuclease-related domain-containing protein [Solirubrobacterales bacterium]
MRILELSNYPGAQLRAHRERRWAENQRRFDARREQVEQINREAQQKFEARLADHEAEVERLRGEIEAPRGNGWWRRYRTKATLRKAERRRPPPPLLHPDPPPPTRAEIVLTREEAKLAAGIEGEDLVADALAGLLGDEWTLVRGYRNGRGEIDQLLLGPQGLTAIEVKHRNATVFVDGDVWRFQKYDNYGNLVKEGSITEGRGRSPSQQLKESVAALEEFLAKRGQPLEVNPVVILSHPRGMVGKADNRTVGIASEPSHILELIDQWDDRLDPERLPAIERLIVKDHEFHEQRLQARGRSS